MREELIKDLVKDILGPRKGLYEELDENPLNEYITGVIAPSEEASSSLDSEYQEEILITEAPIGTEDDFHDDKDVITPPYTSPVLDPEKRPVSFGLSFSVSSSGPPKLHICITWARYFLIEKKDGKKIWKRHPRWKILDIIADKKQHYYLSEKDVSDEQTKETEVKFIIYPKRIHNDIWLINLYFVNNIKILDNEKRPYTELNIFQPQIRVVLGKESVLETIKNLVMEKNDDIEQFLYKDKPICAKGFLCSAVWRDVDPQIQVAKNEKEKDPPFYWIDGDVIPQDKSKKFWKPHVRTEFVPMYLIPFPDMEWPLIDERPIFEASTLSEMFDKEELKKALNPLITGYQKWVTRNEEIVKKMIKKKNPLASVGEKLVAVQRNVLERMKTSLRYLLENDDVRLAFNFACKALDFQSRWKHGGKGLVWRPFQLAFILTALESVANPDSKWRNTADLLWVPTGAGKTEAYLFFMIFIVALRKLRSPRAYYRPASEAGITVLTRYTLRLLTIQQFRRILTAVMAAEKLRVYNLTNKKKIGWRPRSLPENHPLNRDYLWGLEPFSIGLWVGGNVTPNSLGDTWINKNKKINGAISHLKGEKGEKIGEPAQVTQCPVCETLLSIPDEGITGTRTIFWVIKIDSSNTANELKLKEALKGLVTKYKNDQKIKIIEGKVHSHCNGFFTIELKIHAVDRMKPHIVNEVFENLLELAKKEGISITLIPASPSRPGYFIRTYKTRNGKIKGYDFDIYCPNPHCDLNQPWIAGEPAGRIHFMTPEDYLTNQDFRKGIFSEKKYRAVIVPEAFRLCTNIAEYPPEIISTKIPISAYTVDEQIYHRLPSIVVSTVDKMARLPFEPRCSSLFGGVERHHFMGGYYRRHHLMSTVRSSNNKDSCENPTPSPKKKGMQPFVDIDPPEPPSLIIQDELHLIDGPLGSLVGFYESVLSLLSETNGNKIKYIASSATAKEAEIQVKAIFLRELEIFPPHGLNADDRFFIRETRKDILDDKKPGRLYVGVMAPGKGPLTPIIRIYSRLLQTIFEKRAGQFSPSDIDPYWTLVGYFNSIRELGGARAVYRQDIIDRIEFISRARGTNPRPISEDSIEELSGRTESTRLPEILNILKKTYLDTGALDALFTTSMFGTGVDIPRLSLMVVNGQPKTTSSYIQATGRVGRKRGALVITFYRATRPRDLSHYEFFVGYHMHINRFVEPPSVYPFAPGILKIGVGPLLVAALRNNVNLQKRNYTIDRDPSLIVDIDEKVIKELKDRIKYRAENQPPLLRPRENEVEEKIMWALGLWKNMIKNTKRSFVYVEYIPKKSSKKKNVVLGDPVHEHCENCSVIFEKVPQSLRDIEETITVGKGELL